MAWLRSGARAVLLTALLASCAADEEPVTGATGNVVGGGDAGQQGTPLDAGPPLVGNPVNPGNPGNPATVLPGVDGGCGAVKARTEPVKPPVDIVWAIDNSGSMGPHIAAVMNNMVSFMNGVRMSGGNIEVVLMTTPSSADSLLQHAALLGTPNYHWLAVDVQSTDSFRKILANYDGLGNWKQFLRPSAPLHIVVVTDDASDMRAADFLMQMKSKLGGKEFIVHAVGATGAGTDCVGSFLGTGSKDYFDAAMATGGQSLVLCKPWIDAMKTLQTSVVATVPPLPCDYAIPVPPNGQKLDPGAVQVVYTPSGGSDREFALASTADKCADNVAWHYDNATAPTKVIMCPSACETVKAGGGISIGFGCAPSVVLY